MLTRRTFLSSTAAFAAAGTARAENAPANPFRADDYAELRKVLRAFYPNECHGALADCRIGSGGGALADCRIGSGGGALAVAAD